MLPQHILIGTPQKKVALARQLIVMICLYYDASHICTVTIPMTQMCEKDSLFVL